MTGRRGAAVLGAALHLFLATLACGDNEGPSDPLDRGLLNELATAQGSATGSARSGEFAIEITTNSCDCPTLDFNGESVGICILATVEPALATLVEGSGVLVVTTDVPFVSGAIESDGSFALAGTQDISTGYGPLTLLRRMDGRFDTSNDQAEGTAAQRLVGDLAGQSVDCRWLGSFVASRQ